MNKPKQQRQERKDSEMPAPPQSDYSQYNPALTQLEAEIHAREVELEALRKACEVLTQSPRRPTLQAPAPKTNGNGNGNGNGHATAKPATVAEAVERILQETGPMHVKHLLTELPARYAIQTTEKNLINTLNRWVKNGRKFRRPAPSTFALQNNNGMKEGTA